ncbi:hypothetical protein C5E45_16280 [Nocardia nova]|uniref:DUF3703 domain-containing protein n=1 Tax=Nocardia nova TaxID=37330 RepID=A0A2S6APK3_9NOCA|nr:DUF3703 domain-containing protein [Nocardia nova]PPJ27842.1 hypothetical protein C5E41_14565 [Nocardia nova]PPJ37207.1 hypothetical protein C5E45_16280 [Nocardia nova]
MSAGTGIKNLYQREMSAARTAVDLQQRWAHLERAHIVSQPCPWLHTHNHIAMFAQAVAQRDRREALGQIVRIIVASPGSLAGKAPQGNTGRAAVGLRTPMPVPADLASDIAHAV